MLTLSDSRSANKRMKAAGFVQRVRGITDGDFLPPRYPMLRDAMISGDLGLEGFLAAIEPLETAASRITAEARLEADRQLGAFARGIYSGLDVSPDAPPGPLPTPEELKALATVLVAYLDPDGAEPSDEAAQRQRSFTVGRVRNGTARVGGELLPEVAAQLQLLIDSLLNPKVDGPQDLGVHFAPSDESALGGAALGDDSSYLETTYLDTRTRTQNSMMRSPRL